MLNNRNSNNTKHKHCLFHIVKFRFQMMLTNSVILFAFVAKVMCLRFNLGMLGTCPLAALYTLCCVLFALLLFLFFIYF